MYLRSMKGLSFFWLLNAEKTPSTSMGMKTYSFTATTSMSWSSRALRRTMRPIRPCEHHQHDNDNHERKKKSPKLCETTWARGTAQRKRRKKDGLPVNANFDLSCVHHWQSARIHTHIRRTKKTNHIVLDLREREKKKIRQADRFGAYLSASERHHKPVLEVGSHIGNSKFTLQLQDTIKNLV